MHFILITVMSHERMSILNYQKTDCLLTTLSRLRKIIKSPNYWPSVRGNHRWMVSSPHKGPVMRKAFPYREVIILFPGADMPRMKKMHLQATLNLCYLATPEYEYTSYLSYHSTLMKLYRITIMNLYYIALYSYHNTYISIRCRLCNIMILSCKPTYVIPQIESACVEYEELLRHLSLLRARKIYQMGLSFEVLSKFPSMKPEPPRLHYQWSNVWLDFQRDSFKQSNQIMISDMMFEAQLCWHESIRFPLKDFTKAPIVNFMPKLSYVSWHI